jgi:hypothetical protein
MASHALEIGNSTGQVGLEVGTCWLLLPGDSPCARSRGTLFRSHGQRSVEDSIRGVSLRPAAVPSNATAVARCSPSRRASTWYYYTSRVGTEREQWRVLLCLCAMTDDTCWVGLRLRDPRSSRRSAEERGALPLLRAHRGESGLRFQKQVRMTTGMEFTTPLPVCRRLSLRFSLLSQMLPTGQSTVFFKGKLCP